MNRRCRPDSVGTTATSPRAAFCTGSQAYAEVWKARLKGFEETSLPLLEHYDKLGVLWTVKGNSSDEITPKLFREFEKRFAASD